MKINRYKQYFWHYGHKKYIASLVDNSCAEMIEEGLVLHDHLKKADFYPMKVSFSKVDPCENPQKPSLTEDDPISFKVGETADFWLTQNYPKIVLGQLANWEPVLVSISDTHKISIVYFNFANEEDGHDKTLAIEICYIPSSSQMKVEIERKDNISETYIIKNQSSEKQTLIPLIEEYINSKLVKTSEVGEDNIGGFELVTEAE